MGMGGVRRPKACTQVRRCCASSSTGSTHLLGCLSASVCVKTGVLRERAKRTTESLNRSEAKKPEGDAKPM